MSYFARFLFRQFKKTEAQLHPLRYLFWECTLRCNINCLHCGSDCHKNSAKNDFPADRFLQEMQDLSKHIPAKDVMIVITGGEPLMRKDLEEIGIALKKMGYRWGIVTNGFMYTADRHKSLMQAGMGAITLSLDGLEENHNWLRGTTKSYEKAITALDLIRHEKRLFYDVVTCVNKRNIHELDELLNLFIQKKINVWRLFTIAPIGRAKNNPEMLLNKEEFTQLMKFIESNREKKQLDIKFSCEGYVGSFENKVREGYFFCRAGINIGSILVDGSISACPNINNSFVQGNIYETPFFEIWQNKFHEMRERNWTKTGKCKSCKEYKNCKGNGLHYWDENREEVLQCHYEMID